MKTFYTFVFSLAALALVAGCGSSNKAAEPKQAEPPKKVTPKAIQMGPVELIQKDAKLGPQWSVKGKSAQMTMSEDGKGSGDLFEVSGTMFDKNEPAATFTAKQGHADQAAETLNLMGNVVVTAKESSAKLVADHVRWLADRQLIEATGNVTMKTQDYSIGPFPVLLATPDLKSFGTPDRFKKS